MVAITRAPTRRKIGGMDSEDDEEGEDWRLQEWMEHFDKRQVDLAKELGWTTNRAHLVWHGIQGYRRSEVNRIAKWLGIKPYELLMSPRDALALKGLRQTAAMIVAENTVTPYEGPPPSATDAKRAPRRRRTGT